jgi:hypothetical protein
MILEQIDGNVKVVLNGNTLAIGANIEDSQWPLVSVLGVGKATFRVDPNCTVERMGVKATVEEPTLAPVPTPAPAPIVEAVPVVERVTPPIETPSEPTKEA